MFAGVRGLVTTALAIVVAFFPAKQITSLWKYEVEHVWNHAGFHRAGGVFLLRVRPAENAAAR